MKVSLVKPAKIIRELWVCETCMLAHANGVDIRYESDHGMQYDPENNPSPEPEPWGSLPLLYNGTYTVSMGMLYSEHADTCHVKLTDGADRDECGCEERQYDTQSCDGCGSHLHGKRYAFSLWNG